MDFTHGFHFGAPTCVHYRRGLPITEDFNKGWSRAIDLSPPAEQCW